MNIEVKINQRESIRRGVNAPNYIVKIDVDAAALTQPQRDYIAEHLRDGHMLDTEYSNRKHPKPLNEPTLQGFLEMVDAQIAVTAQLTAEQAEEEKKSRAAKEQLVGEAVEIIIRDITLVSVCEYGVESYTNAEDALSNQNRTGYLNGAGYASLPDGIRAMWDAEKERRATILAQRKSEADARNAETEARIMAATEARLTPTQRDMRSRGMLNMDILRRATLHDDAKATRDAIAEKLGEAYDVARGEWNHYSRVTHPNQRQFRQLTAIEKALGITPDDAYINGAALADAAKLCHPLHDRKKKNPQKR